MQEMSQPFTYGCPDKDPLFPTDGEPVDFHYPCDRFNINTSTANCIEQWGFTPRYYWARFGLGGKHIAGASNIVFSNVRAETSPYRSIRCCCDDATPALHVQWLRTLG